MSMTLHFRCVRCQWDHVSQDTYDVVSVADHLIDCPGPVVVVLETEQWERR